MSVEWGVEKCEEDEPRRSSEIDQAATRLRATVQELGKTLDVMFDRLTAVLRPGGVGATPATLRDVDARSPLAEQLDGTHELVADLVERVRAVLSRVDL